MRHRNKLIVVALLAALLVGCSAAPGAELADVHVFGIPIAQAKPASGSSEEAHAATTDEGGYDSCPITLPGEQPFSPPAPYPSTYPYEGRTWYGTASLWTALPDDGRWDQLLHGDKAFWWREGYAGSDEPQPRLWMTATRLDGEGSVEQHPPATNAYHRDFNWAMLTGFGVPQPGCWQITGHYGPEGAERTLSFVVWVGSKEVGD